MNNVENVQCTNIPHHRDNLSISSERDSAAVPPGPVSRSYPVIDIDIQYYTMILDPKQLKL